MIVDVYTRLSQESDRSIERQKERNREYAEETFDDPELTIFNDGRWSSGFDDDRSEWQSLIERIDAGITDAIQADGVRRFARDFDSVTRLILKCRSQGVEIHDASTGEQLDLDDPVSVAVELIQAASEHEAQQRYIAKSREETESRIDAGYYHGATPAGLRFDEAGKYLIIDDDVRDAVERVLNAAGDESIRSIATHTPWTHPTVSTILDRREAYEHVLTGGRLGSDLTLVPAPDPA
ncbi:recombinase family protein [Halobellus ordinarius]|uniref:recombinase family protein n=1 Tax=Halobellus ordinarius TaxID=3075120 RepID=UPI0028803038|nr:recombinase family protein [Halobellus sp. ZY16]